MLKRKILMLLLVFAMTFCGVISATADEIFTVSTDIICTIDGIFIESYGIQGNSYLPVSKLKDYGFVVTEDEEKIVLTRAEIIYFEGDYINYERDNGGLKVTANSKPVYIEDKVANTFCVNGEIVIQADELQHYGSFSYNDKKRTVEILIGYMEYKKRFESIEEKVRIESPSGGAWAMGEMVNGELRGIVRIALFQNGEMYGYLIGDKLEGACFHYVKHQPYLAEQWSVKSYRNGKLNGYVWYEQGYNNKPPMTGETVYLKGVFVDGKMKTGTKKVYETIDGRYVTYIVKDYVPQIFHSIPYGIYKKSDTEIYFKDEKLDFPVQPMVEKDRTLIPIRGFFEHLGATVLWDEKNQAVMIEKGELTLKVRVNYYGADINGETKYMDVPPRLIEGTTMIPIRFLSEELGYRVEWIENSNKIVIS